MDGEVVRPKQQRYILGELYHRRILYLVSILTSIQWLSRVHPGFSWSIRTNFDDHKRWCPPYKIPAIVEAQALGVKYGSPVSQGTRRAPLSIILCRPIVRLFVVCG